MEKPNIIFLLLDQLRPDRLAFSEEFSALKERGVFFSQVITYAPYTIASVHALLSGMYGSSSGVDSYYGSLDFDSANCFTLPQYLKDAGYHTKADVLSKIVLPHQGFDEVDVHDEYKDDLKNRHKEFIGQAALRKPFFLFLHYSNIHTGIISEVVNKYTDFDEKYFHQLEANSKRYDGFVKGAGSYFSGIMDFCQEQGLTQETIFVVLTDHGCSLGEKPGEKCYGVYAYDYTIVTFACFLLPGADSANKQISSLVRSIDIAPTILDILKIPLKSGYKKMQGESLLAMMQGKDNQDREAFSETAGLSGPHPSPYKPNLCAYRTNQWKLIYNQATGKQELYDLKADPREENNLSGKSPEIERILERKMRQQPSRVFDQ